MQSVVIMYNKQKHDDQQIIARVIEPYVTEVLGIHEDHHDYYQAKSITERVRAFVVDCSHVRKPGVMAFAEKKGFDLEKLANDAYFVRGLRKPKSA